MTESSPDRLRWALGLAQTSDAKGISESHGLICGLIVADPSIEPDVLWVRWLSLHPETEDLLESSSKAVSPQQHLKAALVMTKEELQSEEMQFEILVPAAEQPLAQRTEGLAHWCTGFLAGFGASGGVVGDSEAREAFSLLGEIARATSTSDPQDGIDEGEEEAFFELVEFVKVAVLLLHEDRRLGQPSTESNPQHDAHPHVSD
jgi:uncharacterized protein YgfB (UPF0149 family)